MYYNIFWQYSQGESLERTVGIYIRKYTLSILIWSHMYNYKPVKMWRENKRHRKIQIEQERRIFTNWENHGTKYIILI